MGKSSKRYFSRSNHHHKSKSPDIDRQSSSSSSHRNDSHNSNQSNKYASEKLRLLLRDQSKPESNDKKLAISVEEQIRIANKIDEINYDPFRPKQFFSSNRNQSSSISTHQSNKSNTNEMNLDEIPLPKDMNSWYENPRLLLSSKLLEVTKESREQKWRENLLYLGNKYKQKNELN